MEPKYFRNESPIGIVEISNNKNLFPIKQENEKNIKDKDDCIKNKGDLKKMKSTIIDNPCIRINQNRISPTKGKKESRISFSKKPVKN